jgi:hypothetical protein
MESWLNIILMMQSAKADCYEMDGAYSECINSDLISIHCHWFQPMESWLNIILMMQSAKADCCEMNVAYCKCSIVIWLAFIAIGFNQWNFVEYYY